MLSSKSSLRVRNIFISPCRWKTAKFKPKVAKTRPLKTPSAVALDHFDFYYGPSFGKRWPSIRLGLLSPNKYIAIVNTLAENWQANEDMLNDMGSLDLLARIRGKTAEERIEQKKRVIGEQATEEMERAKEEEERELEDSRRNEERWREEEDENDVMRTSAGLGEFQQSQGSLSTAELQLGRGREKVVTDFEITGFEGHGARLNRRSHFIYYPRELRVRTYDRGVLADFPAPIKTETGPPSWWLLDGGSLVPVLALGLEKGDNVLDMCAAPGGKSLLAILTGLPEKVVCNDFKLSRLGQLKRSLATYIPSSSPEADRVILKRKDASNVSTWDEIGVYDKVLADVPCSTDRMAVSQDEGNLFSAQMTNQRLSLPQLQTKILVNALRSVKVGGSVVYSTCTLSSMQNEVVVENAAAIVTERFGLKFVEESLSQLNTHLTSSGLFRFSDQCRTGQLILPFLPSNFGPMYMCKLTRLG